MSKHVDSKCCNVHIVFCYKEGKTVLRCYTDLTEAEAFVRWLAKSEKTMNWLDEEHIAYLAERPVGEDDFDRVEVYIESHPLY